MDLTLETPVRFIPHVGPIMAERLTRLGITTVEQLLYHIPFRYDDFSLVSTIAGVRPDETVTVKGKVEIFHTFITKTGKKMQEARISDETGKLTVIWFNQPYLQSIIKEGATIRFSGTIGWFGSKLVMNSPSYEIVELQPQGPALSVGLHTGRLVPVYPETEGVSSKWLRGRVAFVLEHVLEKLSDYVPQNIIQSQQFQPLKEAMQTVHFPSTLQEAQEAKRRLAFDELLLLQVRASEDKYIREQQQASFPLTIPKDDVYTLVNSLPFQLTGDQKKAINDIFGDLSKSYPMNRLLEGDVGSGKTVVAAIAMYTAHRNGFQSALMAPTQILAEQHFTTISQLLSPLGIHIGLMTGSRKDIDNAQDIFIGTHALLSESLVFEKLGLVIIDEQHRFGVAQRQTLMEKNTKGKIPHLLTMTATPIPRTVAKTILGHMDLSTLTEMPHGRLRIKTWLVPTQKRVSAYSWITKQLKNTGGQAFVICPLIEESETLVSVRAVTQEYQHLKKIFPEFSLGLLHGRMKPKEKSQVLHDFRENKVQILVATPVVEVGIDIPNASIMVIEASERFGLGQLHQLRGRVGRGSLASYCLLFTENEDEKTLTRLKSLETVFSGPELAEIDLKLRGPGELLGTRQHGLPNLKIAEFTDMALIEQTQKALQLLVAKDPSFATFPLLREKAQKSTIDSVTQD